ncbi:MAG: MerR family DNA-binding transcriptional regulator [Gemmatimonadaceae bacterium]|nr:MerR family DNA-binding transcriptional regulator [Gemmatimonadaceae bacterium]
MPRDTYVRIGQAAQLAGVSIDTLRRWEAQGKLTAVRSLGGQRTYLVASGVASLAVWRRPLVAPLPEVSCTLPRARAGLPLGVRLGVYRGWLAPPPLSTESTRLLLHCRRGSVRPPHELPVAPNPTLTEWTARISRAHCTVGCAPPLARLSRESLRPDGPLRRTARRIAAVPLHCGVGFHLAARCEVLSRSDQRPRLLRAPSTEGPE